MRIALTGATGIVGRFIADAALQAGHEVTVLGRRPVPGRAGFRPWALGDSPDLAGHDALVHAAFRHEPGRYRGGEGDDPAGFRRDNLDGSLRLFEAARAGGVGRVVFLSSRAVFDGYPKGTRLTEDLAPAPDSLYGEVKAAAEGALAAMAGPGFRTVSLRATGVYGQPPGGGPHKWSALFAAFRAGEAIAPRVATEVHGRDVARAVLMLLEAPGPVPAAVHASDIVLDRRALLGRFALYAGLAGVGNLPAPAPADGLSVLDCAALHRLGWTGGGMALLDRSLAEMAAVG